VLITETYGGKIDNESDHAVLTSLVERFLTPAAFEENFNILPTSPSDVEAENGHAQGAGSSAGQMELILPTGTAKKDFVDWVNSLPEREPPTFLGLPLNAEKLLLEAHAQEMVRNTRAVMTVLDEGEAVMAEAPDVVF